jgi:hypothetical protein
MTLMEVMYSYVRFRYLSVLDNEDRMMYVIMMLEIVYDIMMTQEMKYVLFAITVEGGPRN